MFILKRYLLTVVVLLGAVSNVSCAEEGSGTTNPKAANEMEATSPSERLSTTEFLSDADTVIFSGATDGFVGSYFSMSDGSADTRAQRILFLMEKAGVSPDFLGLVEQRLPGNRRLKKENFTLPLIDQAGRRHEFEYIVDRDNSFYTLNYRVIIDAQ